MAGIDKENSFRKELRGRMRKLGQPANILGLLLTMLASATAFGEDMFPGRQDTVCRRGFQFER